MTPAAGGPGDSVGTPFVTPDASALLAAANALRASGGGDCPELSQTALLRSVEAALPQSTLFFYSDASAKDSGLARTVVRRAQDKRTRILYALTGSCSPIDPRPDRRPAVGLALPGHRRVGARGLRRTLLVEVPHSVQAPAVDSGERHDSTGSP